MTYRSGRLQGVGRFFEQDSVTLGRDSSKADFSFDVVEARTVSSLHAELYWESGSLWAADCNSLNGTLVDGKPLRQPARVVSGTVLQLGLRGPLIQVDLLSRASFAAPAETDTLFLERLDMPGQLLPLDQSVTSLGREDDCDIVFDGASYPGVSRHHARIELLRDGRCRVVDEKSFNGVFVDDERVLTHELSDGEELELGKPGPKLRFISKTHSKSGIGSEVNLAGQEPSRSQPTHPLVRPPSGIVCRIRDSLMVGRAADCGLQLTSPAVSSHHAVFRRQGAEFTVQDLGSTNGTWLNGQRLGSWRQPMEEGDVISVAAQYLILTGGSLQLFQPKPAIQAFGLTREKKGQTGADGRKQFLLSDITLQIEAGHFVGILGPSGCGKTTLLTALNGLYRAQWGKVYLCGTNLYENYESVRGRLGYVPQYDLMHTELTVKDCLEYTAGLRLPADSSAKERLGRIESVLGRVGLAGREGARIDSLSGGERKRVSTALELLAEPDILFLDEPTSGLDPRMDLELMNTLQTLSKQGKTIVIVTHVLGNIDKLDRVCVLVRGGRMAYYGRPADTRSYFGVPDWKDLYYLLDEQGDEWADRYDEHGEELSGAVSRPRHSLPDGRFEDLEPASTSDPRGQARSSAGTSAGLHQTFVLCRRMAAVMAADRAGLLVLMVGPAMLAGIVAGCVENKMNVLAAMVFSALFFGCFAASKKIVEERGIFLRERLFNLGIWPYVASKTAVLGALVLVQAALLAGVLSVSVSGLGDLTQLWLSASQVGLAGLAQGLLLSALASSTEVTTNALTVLVILELVFAGVLFHPPPQPFADIWETETRSRVTQKVFCEIDPAFWGLDALKRCSYSDDEVTAGPVADAPKQMEKLRNVLEAHAKLVKETVEADAGELAAGAGRPDAEKLARAARRRADRVKALADSAGVLTQTFGDLAGSGKPVVLAGLGLVEDRLVLAGFFVLLTACTVGVLVGREREREAGRRF